MNMKTIEIKRADDHFLYRGDRIINFRPVLFISLSFGLGIFSSFFLGLHSLWINFAWLIAPVIVCIRRIFRKKVEWNILLFAAVLCALFSIGSLSFGMHVAAFEKIPAMNGDCAVMGSVEEISESGDATVYTLDNLLIVNGETAVELDGRMEVYVYGDSDLSIGMKCAFEANITTNDAYSYGRVNSSAIISRLRYRTNVNAENIIFAGEEKVNAFIAVRKEVRGVLFETMSDSNASLAYAMLTGNSGLIEDEVLQNFRYGGIAHIFAVSGLHIGVIYGLLALLFRKIRCNRFIKLAIILIVLFFYVGVCGFSPSSVRAFVMCAVLQTAESMGWQYDRLNSVSLAAFVVLLINPVYLFAVGFQLSLAAAASIIVMGGHISRLLERTGKIPAKICSAIGVALSAQAGTFPILIDCFGYVSAISLFLNLIFVPVISAVYSVIFIFTALACVLPFASGVLLFLPEYLLELAVAPIMLLEFKTALICGFSFGGAMLLWYAAIFLASDKINLKILPKSIGVGLLCCILIAVLLVRNAVFPYEAVLSLHSYYGNDVLLLRQAEKKYLIAMGAANGKQLERLFLQENISYLDGVIILAPEAQINAGVPIILKYVDFKNLYVDGNGNFADSFQKIEVIEEDSFFQLGEADCCFLDGNSLYINVLGADVLICGEALDGQVPDCDLLIAEEYSEELCWKCLPEQEVYFEKTEGKLNLYSAGDLQFVWKNDIITMKRAV